MLSSEIGIDIEQLALQTVSFPSPARTRQVINIRYKDANFSSLTSKSLKDQDIDYSRNHKTSVFQKLRRK